MLPDFNKQNIVNYSSLKKILDRNWNFDSHYWYLQTLHFSESGYGIPKRYEGFFGLYFFLSSNEDIMYIGKTSNCFRERIGCYLRGYRHSHTF